MGLFKSIKHVPKYFIPTKTSNKPYFKQFFDNFYPNPAGKQKMHFWHRTQKSTFIQTKKNLGAPIHLATLSTLTIEFLKFLQKLVLVNFFYS